jgi:hypothetical protein
VQRFVSRVSRVWRIVLILVVIGASNIVIAVIQMVSPQLWRRHRPPGSGDAGTRSSR